MNKDKIIGIVGGVGPVAGLNLVKKIFNQTQAKNDQEHLSVALLSFPQDIGDRTAFLLGETDINPAYAIVNVINKLEKIGACTVGIACNTVHAPQIFDVIQQEMKQANISVKLVNMINEVPSFIIENYPNIKNFGILGTIGTYKTGSYSDVLERKGFHVISPSDVLQETVHSAIYDPATGIKAQSSPVTEIVKSKLLKAANHLQQQGAEAIILGCTEVSLAFDNLKVDKLVMIDPSLILARALIREANPAKLKPLSSS